VSEKKFLCPFFRGHVVTRENLMMDFESRGQKIMYSY